MKTIATIKKEFFQKIDLLDLELIIAYATKKSREFILAHPEEKISESQIDKIHKLIARRVTDEPLAHLLGHKEFFGLNFIVNKYTLIPRPETELLVEKSAETIQTLKNSSEQMVIADIGTGSGCIIISIAKTLSDKNTNRTGKIKYFATDISKEALKIAKINAKRHKVKNKITFLNGNLLDPFLKINQHKKLNIKYHLIINANLPYLSKEIYASSKPNVKNFEPKSALYSPHDGLAHYEKLFTQLKRLNKQFISSITLFIEISPEQKILLEKEIPSYFPTSKLKFYKDLAKRWRLIKIEI